MSVPVPSRTAVMRFETYSYVRQAVGAAAAVTDVRRLPVYAYVHDRSGRPSTAIPTTCPAEVVTVQDHCPLSSKIRVGFPAVSYTIDTARPRCRSWIRTSR